MMRNTKHMCLRMFKNQFWPEVWILWEQTYVFCFFCWHGGENVAFGMFLLLVLFCPSVRFTQNWNTKHWFIFRLHAAWDLHSRTMENSMRPKKLIFTICLFSFQTYGCAARTNHKTYPENFKLWACPPAMGRGVSGEHPVKYQFLGSEENDDPNNPSSNAVDRDTTTKFVSEWLGTRNWVTARARKRTTWILGAQSGATRGSNTVVINPLEVRDFEKKNYLFELLSGFLSAKQLPRMMCCS